MDELNLNPNRLKRSNFFNSKHNRYSGVYRTITTKDNVLVGLFQNHTGRFKSKLSVKLDEDFYILPAGLCLQTLCKLKILECIIVKKKKSSISELQTILLSLPLPKQIVLDFDFKQLQYIKYFATFESNYYFELFPMFNVSGRILYFDFFWKQFIQIYNSSADQTDPSTLDLVKFPNVILLHFIDLIKNNTLGCKHHSVLLDKSKLKSIKELSSTLDYLQTRPRQRATCNLCPPPSTPT